MNLNNSFITLYTLSGFNFFNDVINDLREELLKDKEFTEARDLLLENNEEVLLPKWFEKMAHTYFSAILVREAKIKRLHSKIANIKKELEEESVLIPLTLKIHDNFLSTIMNREARILRQCEEIIKRENLKQALEKNRMKLNEEKQAIKAEADWNHFYNQLRHYYFIDQNTEELKNSIESPRNEIEKEMSILKQEGKWRKAEPWEKQETRKKEQAEEWKNKEIIAIYKNSINKLPRVKEDDEYKLATSQAWVIAMLFKKSAQIIKAYFPIETWGLPSHKLLEHIMNMVLGSGAVKVHEADPFIHSTDDLYSLKENLLIQSLVDKLKELGVQDPLKEVEQEGVFDDIDTLTNILSKAPSVVIRQDPSAYKSRKREGGRTVKIEDELLMAASNMVRLDESKYSAKKMVLKFETYKRYADKYLKPMINKGEKLQDLLKDVKGIPKKDFLNKITEVVIIAHLNKVPECKNALQDLFQELKNIKK